MSNQVRSLSIVIPYYNEERNIERSLQGALDYLRPRLEDFEIIAVDDCSTDGTREIARRVQATEPRIKIVCLETNSKFAGALKKGFAAATKDYVFYTDGDCPIDYEDLGRAFAALDRYDVVVGARVTRDKEGLIRKIYTNGYRLTLRMLLGLRFRDINFSFKLFPRQALRGIEIESEGSFIDAEILYKLQKRGWRIGEIPVHYHSRIAGASTLASPGIIWKILRELLSFWHAQRKQQS